MSYIVAYAETMQPGTVYQISMIAKEKSNQPVQGKGYLIRYQNQPSVSTLNQLPIILLYHSYLSLAHI
ncbi:hypothetical protein [Evansella cellulosilytica]|uniref:hypothetical protein n=1 Tax=Evansella cellulosilytica TaxID=1413 RepID=UPI0001C24E69|nr:hypothetical protein [Evansella cellulosilytica]